MLFLLFFLSPCHRARAQPIFPTQQKALEDVLRQRGGDDSVQSQFLSKLKQHMTIYRYRSCPTGLEQHEKQSHSQWPRKIQNGEESFRPFSFSHSGDEIPSLKPEKQVLSH